MTILFTGLILDDLPLLKEKKKRVKNKERGTVSFWCSHVSVLEAPDINVTDLIALSYHECALVFLSLSINAANTCRGLC